MTVDTMALLGFGAIALRGAAAVAIVAVLAGGLPRIVQLGLAVTFGVWSAALVALPLPPTAGALVATAARELVVGATIGIAAALPLVIAATAGRWVDVASGDRGPYRALFGVLAAAVFVGIDGHVMVLAAIVESHRELPAIGEVQPRVLQALGALLDGAVRLAVPWLVTAAVVEIAVGVGSRLGGRAALAVPGAVAVPAALAMITATLVGTFAVATAALVRGTL